MGIQPRNKNLLSTAMHGLSLVLFSFLLLAPQVAAQQSFSLEQVMSAPFPSDLVAAKSVPRVRVRSWIKLFTTNSWIS